jgi:hypothetical protein
MPEDRRYKRFMHGTSFGESASPASTEILRENSDAAEAESIFSMTTRSKIG